MRLRKVLSTALTESAEQRFKLGRRPDWRARRGRSALIHGPVQGGGRSGHRRERERPRRSFLSRQTRTRPPSSFLRRGRRRVPPGEPVEPVAVATPVATAKVDEVAPVIAPIRCPTAMTVPAAAQAHEWLDTALASPSYEVPAGIFDTRATPQPRRSAVLVKTLLYAAAGLLFGVGGGLLVARTWFAAPVQPAAESTGIVARVPVRPSPRPLPRRTRPGPHRRRPPLQQRRRSHQRNGSGLTRPPHLTPGRLSPLAALSCDLSRPARS